MTTRRLPDRIIDISESDFWKSFKIRNGLPHGCLLEEAIRYGLSGRTADAYLALTDYAASWQESILQGARSGEVRSTASAIICEHADG